MNSDTPAQATPETYAAVFEDRRGREHTVIHNDGRELRLSLRGVSFSAVDFDLLSPEADQLSQAQALFTLQRGNLCSCRLEWEMPLALERSGQRLVARLGAVLVLGDPLANGSLSSETITLTLKTPDQTVRSSGKSGWFEDELLELCGLLAPPTRMRSCLTCAFSDYFPAGHGLFGGLACFRDVRDEYLEITDKAGFFDIWSRLTELVQETYLCGEFEPRVPGTGYRG